MQARRGLFELYRSQGASVWIEATGSSMSPAIGEGDWLLVDFAAGTTAVGEIVVYPLGEAIVVHRVVRRTGENGNRTIATKGDARVGLDPPLPEKQVLGVVRAVRYGEDGEPDERLCSGPRAVAVARLSAVGGPAGRLSRGLARITLRLVAPNRDRKGTTRG
jgi:signal peptidase I